MGVDELTHLARPTGGWPSPYEELLDDPEQHFAARLAAFAGAENPPRWLREAAASVLRTDRHRHRPGQPCAPVPRATGPRPAAALFVRVARIPADLVTAGP
ncbi:hypothetical protein GCM10020229_72190 [Kitasatospora albolonga]|uniref:hypothetical protein n=1 Tax=Kitasatospora albolonga TaxID=68173 RepID=UPI0031ED1903